MTKKQTIDCEQALARLFDFIDRELNAEEHDAMQEHLHACKSCFSRAEFERRLKGKLGRLHEDAAPAAKSRIKKLIKGL